jgi:CubicO group peptidase (beta-lactamase class C family)
MKRCYALALMFAFGTAPCSAAAGPPSAASAITVTPADVSQAIAALDAIAHDLQRRSGVPGIAIAVVHDDRVVYLKGFGVRKAGTNQRVDADTVFELASVSKPVGAAVIAGAVGRGIVKWTDPVQKYLPWFALSDPYVSRAVTIGDMYAHRSGLPDHAGDLLEDLGYDRAAILKRLALEPLDPFRITYHYTNFGITAAALAVAEAEHMSWEDLSQRILYGPLGMTSTSSRYADYANAADRAALHVRVGNAWLPKYTRDADAQSPAGGVSSSARDMAQWLRFELANGKYGGKQIVSEEALLATRVPNLVSSPLATPESRASFYGFGIGVGYDEGGRLRLSHSGAFASGAATTVLMLPSEKLGIVVLSNGMPVGVPESIAASFFDIVEFGKVQRDWYAAYGSLFAHLFVNPSPLAGKKPPSNPKPPRLFSGYVGTYANAYYGPLTILARNGRLVMQLGPRHQTFPLTHWDANTFIYMPAGENAVGVSRVVFVVAPGSSRSVKVIIDNLNESGLGTFGR